MHDSDNIEFLSISSSLRHCRLSISEGRNLSLLLEKFKRCIFMQLQRLSGKIEILLSPASKSIRDYKSPRSDGRESKRFEEIFKVLSFFAFFRVFGRVWSLFEVRFR